MTEDQLHDCEAVHGYVSRICFKNGPPALVGAELELLLAGADPQRPVSLSAVRDAFHQAAPFPGGSALTFEPGGQVELSSPTAPDLTGLVAALQSDLDQLVTVLAGCGLAPLDSAVDPVRPPLRQLHTPRYDAMEAYFDALEPQVAPDSQLGRTMMCSTAATQVNLDAGPDPALRWRLLHDLGPVMVAAFANSPMRLGRPTGWKSARQQIWRRLDPARTAVPAGDDPVTAYTAVALDAPVMMRRTGGSSWQAAPGFTFREWLAGPRETRPTQDDLAYHLTTLFPPVRPRGWLEVRYVDAQPLRWWSVPVAVLAALVDDPVAADLAADAAGPARGRWGAAARVGLGDPVLLSAARACFAIAHDSLSRHHPLLVELVDAFAAAYVERGRCPADDVLDPVPSLREDPV